MITTIIIHGYTAGRVLRKIYAVILFTYVSFNISVVHSQESPVPITSCITGIDTSQIIYENPRVYNVAISFEINPDPSKIDREHDLKVWIPIPREWNSQKNVQIISTKPEPHFEYTDPEYGNTIFYWDFGKYPVKPSYRIDIQARLLSYEVHTLVDSSGIKPYNTTSAEYKLYTRSSHTVHITPIVEEMVSEAVGNETNSYLKAQKICSFVHEKIRYYQGMDDRSLDWLLSHPSVDERSGEEYFTGACTEYAALFVAMCRSEGIPARCVYGRIGWVPYLNDANSTMYSYLDTVLTEDGFAGAQHHGLGPHMWAEFYLQDIGWIPVDPNAGSFGLLHNYKVILSKGRDIFLGPNIPQEHHNGYGYQWVPIVDGRVDGLLSAVYNIERISEARSNVYHTPDPFPADALVDYKSSLFSDDNETLINNRREFLCNIDYCSRDIPDRDLEFSKIFDDPIWIRSLQYSYDAFVCHMLNKIMGVEKFNRLLTEYERLLVNSPAPIQTNRVIQMAGTIFGESMEWFFDQWEKINGLPHLKVDEVVLEKTEIGWSIRGKLIQSGESIFSMPVEFSVETETDQQFFTIWCSERKTDFEFRIVVKPLVLKADANHDLLKLQRMPLQLSQIWNSYPDITLVYGTISESEVNKTAAERFNNEYLGLNPEIIKPDTSITDNDLNAECVVLFGRPETNKITKCFEELFPLAFNGNSFIFNRINYDKPSQGLAQVTEHPLKSKGLFIQYAGLSAKAMLQFGDLYLYDSPNSFVIYDGDQEITSGDWESDTDLVWKF